MNISGAGRMIAGATRDLSVRWAETKHSWKDVKAEQFEQTYLSELFGSVERVVSVFEDLDKVVAKAREDCE